MKIKCSKCGKWKGISKDRLERRIKKEGKNFVNWLKNYKCRNCRENVLKEKLNKILDKESMNLIK